MPFFIPIMIAATVASMIPSFLPHNEKQAERVITQDGRNYYNRQTIYIGLTATPFRGNSETLSERLVELFHDNRLDRDVFQNNKLLQQYTE